MGSTRTGRTGFTGSPASAGKSSVRARRPPTSSPLRAYPGSPHPWVSKLCRMTDGAAQAIILMAYGSPDRIEDVPAYYEDIRGGRAVPQEQIDELVERYQRLGIGGEAVSPLNAFTEETRAAL